jgi:acetyl-CoA carboxylase biotin carboxyl carrier protein
MVKTLVEQAKDLMRWADEYGIDEISVSDGEDRIKISRGGAPPPKLTSSTEVQAEGQLSPSSESLQSHASKRVVVEEESPRFTIVSPMVGTFYLSPSPELSPFKSVGDRISQGDTVCIVEAMKVMNQIKTPQDGVLKRILVKNSELVYKGQVLMEIG